MTPPYILLNNCGGSADIGDQKSSADSPVKIYKFDVWKAFVVQKLKLLYKKYQHVTISNIQTLENFNISHTSIFVRTAETPWFLVLQAPPMHPITVNLMKIKQNFADLSYQVYVGSYKSSNTSHLFPPHLSNAHVWGAHLLHALSHRLHLWLNVLLPWRGW